MVLVRVAFANDYADRLNQEVDAPTPTPSGGMPAEWSELVPEIGSLQADVIITKRQWSAFYGTELDLQLRRRGIKTIAEDACSSVSAELHQFSIENVLKRVARVRSTAEILTGLTLDSLNGYTC